jgi:hypothetical protein
MKTLLSELKDVIYKSKDGETLDNKYVGLLNEIAIVNGMSGELGTVENIKKLIKLEEKRRGL